MFGGLPVEFIISQGIFCLLFVWLLVNTRKESKEREERLMDHLDTVSENHKDIVESVDRLEKRIDEHFTK